MSDEKLISRLQKLLALTESPNENESASAAAMLQKFLTQHNLSMADLEMKGATAPGMKENVADLGKAAFKWKLDLAEGIAEFYFCAPIVNRAKKTVRFVGRPDNVESLQMLYIWVIDQIKEISKNERRKHYDLTQEHIDPLRWQLGFGEGAVERLIDRLREMKARQAEDMSHDEFGNITALAIHHQAEVSDYLEKEYGYRTDGKETERQRKSRERSEAYWAELERKEREQENLKLQCETAGDMAPYYAAYPDQHPDVIAKAEAEAAKRNKAYEAKERRNEARRTGRSSWREAPTDWVKEEQKQKAQASGRENASKVNLQPFVGDGKKPTKGAIG